MYELDLKTSLAPAQDDIQIRDITIGDLLRAVASERTEAEALVEVTQDGSAGRRWTYGQLRADREALVEVVFWYEVPTQVDLSHQVAPICCCGVNVRLVLGRNAGRGTAS